MELTQIVSGPLNLANPTRFHEVERFQMGHINHVRIQASRLQFIKPMRQAALTPCRVVKGFFQSRVLISRGRDLKRLQAPRRLSSLAGQTVSGCCQD